jgi:hypothetical protein
MPANVMEQQTVTVDRRGVFVRTCGDRFSGASVRFRPKETLRLRLLPGPQDLSIKELDD